MKPPIDKSLFLASILLGLFSLSALAEETQGPPRLLASHPNGTVGLFHTYSAQSQVSGPSALGLSFTGQYLRLGDFPTDATDMEKWMGKFSLSYHPFDVVEFFLAGSALTNNDSQAGLLVQQVGNLDFGTKLKKEIGAHTSLGAMFIGHYGQPLLDRSLTQHPFSYEGMALASFEFTGKPTLRLHANAGYRWDDSDKWVDATFSERDAILLGALRKNAILGLVGMELVIPHWIFSLEYSTEQTLKTSGIGYLDNPQRITPGIRYFPMMDEGFSIGVAADLCMFATRKVARVYKEPDYSFLVNLSYLFGSNKKTPSVSSPSSDGKGTLYGIVSDAKTSQPVGGALIELCGEILTPPVTSDSSSGVYRSNLLKSGECEMKVSHPNFEPMVLKETVVANVETQKNIALTPKEVLSGMLLLDVKGADGFPLKASLRFPEIPRAKSVETNAQGKAKLRLPAGTYSLEASSEGMKAEVKNFEVVAGQEIVGEFVLHEGVAKLKEKEISISKQVQFATGKAELVPSSKEILDEVALILVNHPEIQKVEIGGHTDSSGSRALNLKLSKQRAEAVRNYLVEQSVDAGRLTVVGYGPDKPLNKENTKEAKMANRRVEFKILSE